MTWWCLAEAARAARAAVLGLAADTAPTGLDSTLAQYGAVGVIAAAGLWFGLRAWQREVRRGDALADELRALNADLRDRVVPTLTEVTRVLGEVVQIMRDRR